MAQYSLGLDFGTNSVRALIADTQSGEEISTAICEYRRGDRGIFYDPKDPLVARQHPADYFESAISAIRDAIGRRPDVDPYSIVGIGVDATASTPVPVDAECVPLAISRSGEAAEGLDLASMAWLWKDHSAHAEAEEITDLARRRSEPYLTKCGGAYSSEWFWSKILRCARHSPGVFRLAESWIELQDLIPAWLCGIDSAAKAPRGICAAAHKAMYHPDWGGLPSKDFLNELDPSLAELRDRLYERAFVVGEVAGHLCRIVAEKCGLREGIPVSVGGIDAHLGALGSGIRKGRMVKILGTSTCDIIVGDEKVPDIEGVSGVAPSSVIPGMLGIEAGQAAVGDLFEWFARELAPGMSHEELNRRAAALRPGEAGLVALDWNNGNRCPLADSTLTGVLVGQTLRTTASEIYRALIEATAFGARMIIDLISRNGVPIEQIVVGGGIAAKSPLVLQIYADICQRSIFVARSEQTSALGAAICGAVAGGAHSIVEDAVSAMTGLKSEVVSPDSSASEVYNELYSVYCDLHRSFGAASKDSNLNEAMQKVRRLRERACKAGG